MKPTIAFGALIAVFLLGAALTADSSTRFADSEMRNMVIDTVEDYVEALEEGAVDELSQHMTPAFHHRRFNILHARGYAERMRNSYDGVELNVQRVTLLGAKAEVQAMLHWPNGNSQALNLVLALRQDNGEFRFLIASERTTSRL